jgi:dihydropteroate synthase
MVYSDPMIDLAEWEDRRDRVLVMGIVNVTPDSFYDGGRYSRHEDAIEHGVRMADEGADIVDVGGESTRPGSQAVPTQAEMDRVLPVVEGIRRRSPVCVSIDTTKADVAEEAIRLGAGIVNDVSALRFDERMAAVVARAGAFAVLMHMQGSPETMQRDPNYSDVVEEVRSFLDRRTRTAVEAGIPEERIFVDPGIGFGKTLEHNLTLLGNLSRLAELGRPVLVGTSRKAFLGAILEAPPDDRIEGTIAANAVAILNGASIIRVHDVKEGRRTADVAARLRDHVTASR